MANSSGARGWVDRRGLNQLQNQRNKKMGTWREQRREEPISRRPRAAGRFIDV